MDDSKAMNRLWLLSLATFAIFFAVLWWNARTDRCTLRTDPEGTVEYDPDRVAGCESVQIITPVGWTTEDTVRIEVMGSGRTP